MDTKLVDVDPELLRRSAEAALHAAEQSNTHFVKELTDDPPDVITDNVMTTLTASGPYGFTTSGELATTAGEWHEHPRVDIASTAAEVRQHYDSVHNAIRTTELVHMVEVRGGWYTFHESVPTIVFRGSGETIQTSTLLLLPCGAGRGVVAELVWSADDSLAVNGDSAATRDRRSQSVLRHERYLEALRAGDVDGVLDITAVDAHSIARDYVGGTGALVSMNDLQSRRAYYESFFERFVVHQVDLLQRLAFSSYLFAEIRITASDTRAGNGDTRVAFHVAEFFAPGADAQFIVHFGHGTDPEPS